MSAAIGVSGAGTKIEVSTDVSGAPNYTEVLQVDKFTSPDDTVGFGELSNFNTPNGRREWQPTQYDDAMFQLEYTWNQKDAGQLILAAAFKAKKLISVRVTYPTQADMQTGLVRTFQAWVQKNPMPSVDLAAIGKITTSLKLNGDITDVAGQ